MKQATQSGRGSFELIPLNMRVAVTGSIVQLEFSWNMILTGVLVAQLSSVPISFSNADLFSQINLHRWD